MSLPRTLRRSKLYRTMVEGTLRFLIEQVGEVDGVFPEEGQLSSDFALRRAAGNGIELAGVLAFRASPVWVMAALADISGASRHLIGEIARTLQDEGLLEPGTDFRDVDHILDGLERTAGQVADTVNTPPLDIAGLRKDLTEIRRRLGSIPPDRLPSADLLGQLWRELREESAAQDRSVFQLSSLMALAAARRVPGGIRWFSRSALTAARRGGQVVAGVLLEDYRTTLGRPSYQNNAPLGETHSPLLPGHILLNRPK